jgi:hypothetical protein
MYELGHQIHENGGKRVRIGNCTQVLCVFDADGRTRLLARRNQKDQWILWWTHNFIIRLFDIAMQFTQERGDEESTQGIFGWEVRRKSVNRGGSRRSWIALTLLWSKSTEVTNNQIDSRATQQARWWKIILKTSYSKKIPLRIIEFDQYRAW